MASAPTEVCPPTVRPLAGKPNEGTLIMIVIGVDPHKRSHTAAAVEASTGELLGSTTVAARDRGTVSWFAGRAFGAPRTACWDDDHRGALIAGGDEREREVGCLAVQRDVSHFVDDDQGDEAEAPQLAFQVALALGVERRAIHSVAVAKATPLSAEEREALARAARDLPGLWHAETTTARDRKELLRTLVAEAIVTVHQQPRRAEIEIAWEGGARSQLSVPLIRRGSVNEGRAGPTRRRSRARAGNRAGPGARPPPS